MISFDMATKLSWNACSVSVSVSASELRNVASIARATLGAPSGVLTPTM
jgi:hypothetical protein